MKVFNRVLSILLIFLMVFGALTLNIRSGEAMESLGYFPAHELTLDSITWGNYAYYNTFVENDHTHSYTSIVTPPTCVEQGYTTHSCRICEKSYTDSYVSGTGHNFTEWYTIKEATYNENGSEGRDCTKCSHFEARETTTTVLSSGNFGYGQTPTNKVIYTLYSDGTMLIEGEGALFGAKWNGADQPFIDYRKHIKRIIIGEGITSTSSGCFAYLTNLESVSFPSTMKKFPNNAFMGSFASSVTTLTIPKNVVTIGNYTFGYYNGSGTCFTDIIIENPNISFYDGTMAFNSGTNVSQLTLYSYGEKNTVSAYAERIGCTYINLNDYIAGETNGIYYTLSAGVLKLTATKENPTIPVKDQPWLAKASVDSIHKIIIGEGIISVPSNAFYNYTSLAEVELNSGIKTIGDRAFATSEKCESKLALIIPKRIESLGKNIFSGRKNVNVTVYYGSVAEKFNEEGVTVKIKKQFKLLMIGNSYTEDASNRGQGMKQSQLFNILQAMLGEDAEVTLGAITSGGKGINWHATQAEQDTKKYSFTIVTSKNREWQTIGVTSSAEALAWEDWDAVSLQHYGLNTVTGQESIPYPNETDEKFYPLKVASEYMLDHINKYAPTADVYFYAHWAQTKTTALNAALAGYNKMAAYLPVVLEYAGTTNEKQFKNIVPVGLSVQNARSTYLALLKYNPTAYDDKNLNLYTDAQIGLQRDPGHLSFNIGRYIAALTFAEILIPSEMRAEDYSLPDIRITESIGKLPKEYTEIAQKAVFAAVDSWKRGSLAVTMLEGYEEDPTVSAGKTLSKSTVTLTCSSDIENLKKNIKKAVLAILPSDFAVDNVVLSENLIYPYGSSFTCDVTIRFGYTSLTVTVKFNVSEHAYTSFVTEPTYEENGYTTHTCTGCGHTYKDSFTDPLTYLKGDINNDGKINNLDAARLMQYIAGWDVECVEVALDVSGDGKINNLDAARLMQYIAGWAVEIH